MSIFNEVVLGIALVVLFAGCASGTARVIAHREARFNLSPTNRICLAEHAQPRESEVTLQQALRVAVHERGIELVPSDQAEFTLTYWIEDSWKPGKKVVYYSNGRWSDVYPMTTPNPDIMGPWPGFYESRPDYVVQRVVNVPYYIQGIQIGRAHV